MKIARRDMLMTVAAAGLTGAARSLLAEGRPQFSLSVKRLTLKHIWTIARNSSDYKDNVFVRIERDGIVGWGEAAPNVRYGESAEKTLAVLEQARPFLESGDWFEYVDLRRRWETFTKDQTCAGAALDMAVLDWVGRKLNVPLCQLFGLDGNKAPLTTFSIGIDTPDVVRQKVREAADFPVLKIKVGRDNDAEILAAVRDVTDCPLRVDANEGWRDKRTALDKIRWLQDLGVELIEQPMPAAMLEETAWLRDRVDIPIIADEAVKRAADIPKLAHAYDGINIKLMKSGGIQEALCMIHVARALGLKIMLGCMIASSVSITAAAHLSPLIDYADLDGNLLIADDPFTGVTVDRGRLILPTGPGLGVTERRV
ncbi:MAG TPA: dipeptide epimerase [Sedimentisphaerales bacterium]|nr:dipeptide epimerase [Sedimentisphaerales bacterium]HRS11671.1 dipeptide epimerase [Sedimentisphaerales bacterium]HRV48334.1 dipeptide epimerase [Sedimentisphaerales bacterium]